MFTAMGHDLSPHCVGRLLVDSLFVASLTKCVLNCTMAAAQLSEVELRGFENLRRENVQVHETNRQLLARIAQLTDALRERVDSDDRRAHSVDPAGSPKGFKGRMMRWVDDVKKTKDYKEECEILTRKLVLTADCGPELNALQFNIRLLEDQVTALVDQISKLRARCDSTARERDMLRLTLQEYAEERGAEQQQPISTPAAASPQPLNDLLTAAAGSPEANASPSTTSARCATPPAASPYSGHQASLQHIAELQSRMDALSKTNTHLRAELREHEHKLGELTEHLAGRNIEIDTLHRSSQVAMEEAERQEKKAAYLTATIAQLTAQLAESEDSQKSFKALAAKVQSLEMEVAKGNDMNNKLRLQCKELERQQSGWDKEAKKREKDFESLVAAEKESASFRAQIVALSAHMAREQTARRETEVRLAEALNQQEETAQQLRKLRQEFSQLELSADAAQLQLHDHEKLEAQYYTMKKDLLMAQQEAENSAKEQRKTAAQFALFRKVTEHAQKHCNRVFIRGVISEAMLTQEIEVLRSAKGKAETSLREALDVSIPTLQKQLEGTKAEAEASRSSFEDAKAQMSIELRHAKAQNKDLQQAILQLEAQLRTQPPRSPAANPPPRYNDAQRQPKIESCKNCPELEARVLQLQAKVAALTEDNARKGELILSFVQGETSFETLRKCINDGSVPTDVRSITSADIENILPKLQSLAEGKISENLKLKRDVETLSQEVARLSMLLTFATSDTRALEKKYSMSKARSSTACSSDDERRHEAF